MRRIVLGIVILLSVVVTVGCQQSKDGDKNNVIVAGGGGTEASRFLLAEEPAGAKGVLEMKKDAKDGDEVLLVGRVGGSVEPMVKGRASFTIVDPSLKPCNERPGDTCKTPWDYCCDDRDDLVRATVMIKFVDEGGKTLERDARELLGVEPLKTVVVRGKAKRDADGNVTVLASGLHLRQN